MDKNWQGVQVYCVQPYKLYHARVGNDFKIYKKYIYLTHSINNYDNINIYRPSCIMMKYESKFIDFSVHWTVVHSLIK